jgi:hypothetical protein
VTGIFNTSKNAPVQLYSAAAAGLCAAGLFAATFWTVTFLNAAFLVAGRFTAALLTAGRTAFFAAGAFRAPTSAIFSRPRQSVSCPQRLSGVSLPATAYSTKRSCKEATSRLFQASQTSKKLEFFAHSRIHFPQPHPRTPTGSFLLVASCLQERFVAPRRSCR